MSAEVTRQRLMDATVRTLVEDGIAGLSARAIAGRADINQALIFYHFDSVENLLAVTARTVSADRAQRYRDRLATVGSFAGLVDAARELHAEEHRLGNLALLTQLLAATRTYPGLAPTLEANFELFVGPAHDTIRRLIDDSVLDGVLATEPLARAISAGVLGAELLAPAMETAAPLFEALDTVAGLVDVLLDAGTISTALIRRRLSSATTTPTAPDGSP